jgi:hypothetical protein
MANGLLYKASLHLGASPQNKRSSLLYQIPTVGNRQQVAHECADHCLLGDDGQDLFKDTSMSFQMIGMCEWLWGNVNGLR